MGSDAEHASRFGRRLSDIAPAHEIGAGGHDGAQEAGRRLLARAPRPAPAPPPPRPARLVAYAPCARTMHAVKTSRPEASAMRRMFDGGPPASRSVV